MSSEHTGRKCLVLDLDETLLHSSFKVRSVCELRCPALESYFCMPQAIPSADYIVPVEIESQTHNVYVIKRPGVDNFLRQMGEIYEVVVFTASLSKVSGGTSPDCGLAEADHIVSGLVQYADPVLDMLDIHGVVKHRLFRESCYNHNGNYVKVSRRSPPAQSLVSSFPPLTPTHPPGPLPIGPRDAPVHHHRQLAGVVHLPPQQCRPRLDLVQRPARHRAD